MFQKATRKQIPLKIALTGVSGSGKTMSALMLASGLGKKIAVMDTENGSASLYSDRFDFDVMELRPPYTIEKYIEAIKGAVDAKYDVLIIDSISHAWSGEGGLLQQKEQLDQRGGNSFTNWAKMTPKQELFISTVLHSQIDTICTMRSKQEYVIETNSNGKSAPKKVGLAPIQRDGVEYEFTTVLDIALNHEAVASKDRTGLFMSTERIFRITPDTGKELAAWRASATELHTDKTVDVPKTGDSGKPVETIPINNPAIPKTIKKTVVKLPEQYLKKVKDLLSDLTAGYSKEGKLQFMKENMGITKFSDFEVMNIETANKLFENLSMLKQEDAVNQGDLKL